MILRVSFFLLLFSIAGARANWCMDPARPGSVTTGAPCGDAIPNGWIRCGSAHGMAQWCPPAYYSYGHQGSRRVRSDYDTLILVAAGVAFVGLMWYLFRTPQSDYYPGQVVFGAFKKRIRDKG